MGTLLNNDDVIWLKHVNADGNTLALLKQLPPNTRLKLEIEGVRGDWMRMADGADGRPTLGLKPVGDTVNFWKSLRKRRGDHLAFRIVDPLDRYLDDIAKTLTEWDSDEDEEAFHDL